MEKLIENQYLRMMGMALLLLVGSGALWVLTRRLSRFSHWAMQLLAGGVALCALLGTCLSLLMLFLLG